MESLLQQRWGENSLLIPAFPVGHGTRPFPSLSHIFECDDDCVSSWDTIPLPEAQPSLWVQPSQLPFLCPEAKVSCPRHGVSSSLSLHSGCDLLSFFLKCSEQSQCSGGHPHSLGGDSDVQGSQAPPEPGSGCSWYPEPSVGANFTTSRGPVALGASVGETGAAASGRLLPAVHVPGSPGWEGRVILLVDAFVGTSP